MKPSHRSPERFRRCAALAGLLGLCSAASQADVIGFESGFADQQAVTAVATATNTVGFSVGGGPAYIAKVGAPVTAFNADDMPANTAISGNYFLTDERAGPSTTLDYFLSFLHPVSSLSLNLYDYRADGGAGVGDTATLSVYSDLAMTALLGTDVFTIPANSPDGNVEFLSVAGLDSILAASVTFSHTDIGTGIDNIAFETAAGTVPEPATPALAALGLMAAFAAGRRRG